MIQTTVYCPFGDVWNGMIAVNEKDQVYEIIIQYPEDNTEKLEDAIRRTKIVDWQRAVTVPFAQYHVIECLRRALGDQLEMELLPIETRIFEKPVMIDDIKVPQGISLGPITLEHLELVDSTWPHRYATSHWYFRLLINAKLGYGLFEDNKLVSWVFNNEAGNLRHLYTVQNHRRKGYGELMLKLISNILYKEGKPVVAYCVTDNLKGSELYNKLGFIKGHPGAWCYLNKSKE